jgi:hypothetical protein
MLGIPNLIFTGSDFALNLGQKELLIGWTKPKNGSFQFLDVLGSGFDIVLGGLLGLTH